MTGVVRLGDISTGHGCFPARPNIQASPNVFADNIAIHRLNDAWETHCCGPVCHGGALAVGSPNVFINNMAVGRVGDTTTDGDTAALGSVTVFAN